MGREELESEREVHGGMRKLETCFLKWRRAASEGSGGVGERKEWLKRWRSRRVKRRCERQNRDRRRNGV